MPEKVLFIDRDGTLILEPPVTFQVDSLEQLTFLPGVIRNLYKITKEMDYSLVIVTNQDGLGTDSNPEANFETVQNKMLEIFAGEGIAFKAVHIDRSFPHEQKATRKPGTGMLTGYLNGSYDLQNSYVIGDRLTDVQLAQNLGCKAIFIENELHQVKLENTTANIVKDWNGIYDILSSQYRAATVSRITNETKISIEAQLDGQGKYSIHTGISFFDHMLEQLSRHSGVDLIIKADGDLHIDEHHTIEDVAITLGEVFHSALGKKAGINRYGFTLPMDDCLAQVAIDFGGRPWLVWDVVFNREKIGEMPTEMCYHFFKSFSDSAKCNLNIKAEGQNEHHKIESIFKAFAKSIKMAIRKEGDNQALPTTKGIL
jgi:imidazoleglycerol-phosphate dehydratase/histidinol-phosphatase